MVLVCLLLFNLSSWVEWNGYGYHTVVELVVYMDGWMDEGKEGRRDI